MGGGQPPLEDIVDEIELIRRHELLGGLPSYYERKAASF